jgi:FAD dependent oxidoreductase
MSERYDAAVVGAGIAGLATAEIAARSGLKVVLLERNHSVCTEASGGHHGWFHFGSLYSIFPNNQFMRTLVGGIDDLLEYYSSFPGMNVRVGDAGKLVFPSVAGAWIRDEPIQYIVAARNDNDFDLRRFENVNRYVRKLLFTLGWDLTIKQFISRHVRFHKFDWRSGPASESIPMAGWFDYSRSVISKVQDSDFALERNSHFQVSGFDRPMNSEVIVRDLLSSFLGYGGMLIRDCSYLSHNRSRGVVEVATTKGSIGASKLLLATGRALSNSTGDRVRLRIVASPLLVTYPALCARSWARLTPFVEKTVNHLVHYASGAPYSVVGGGYLANANDEAGVAEANKQLQETAYRVFPRLKDMEMVKTYTGFKTEVVSRAGERNYQYFIRRVEEDVFALVPGKFSLGCSLAVNAYKNIWGKDPSKDAPGTAVVPEDSVRPPKHQELVVRHLAELAASAADSPSAMNI